MNGDTKINFSQVAHLYSNPFNPIKVMVDGKHIQYLRNISTCKDGGKHYVFISCTDNPFSQEVDDDSWSPLNDDERLSRIKPLLYPMSAISTIEHHDISIDMLGDWHGHFTNALKAGNKYVLDYRDYPQIFLYLLSKHYDLFGLIESGEAIDITTLTQTT